MWARYLLVTEVPNYEWAGKLADQSGVRTRDLRFFKQAAITTAPGSPAFRELTTALDDADWIVFCVDLHVYYLIF